MCLHRVTYHVNLVVFLAGTLQGFHGIVTSCHAASPVRASQLVHPFDLAVELLEKNLQQPNDANSSKPHQHQHLETETWQPRVNDALEHLRQDDLEQALVKAEEANEILETKNSWGRDRVFVLGLCGAIHYRLLDYESAHTALAEAGNVARKFALLDNQETAAVMHLLADTYLLAELFRESLVALKEAERLRTAVLGESHAMVVRTRRDMVYTYCELGNVLEAERVCQDVLPSLSSIDDEDHMKRFLVLCALGRVALENWKWEEARESLGEALELLEATEGAYAIEQADLLSMIVLAYLKGFIETDLSSERLDPAVDLIDRAIRTAESELGAHHPMHIKSLLCAAELHVKRNDIEAMARYYNTAGELCVGKNEQTQFPYRFQLAAQVDTAQGDYEEGDENYEKACLWYSILGQRLRYMEARLEQARLRQIMGKGILAVFMYGELGAERKELIDRKHPLGLRATYYSAISLHENGSYEEALNLFERLVERFESFYGSQSIWTCMVKVYLGCTLVELKSYEKGASELRAALEIMEEQGWKKLSGYENALQSLTVAEQELTPSAGSEHRE